MTESQYAILRGAECEPDTRAVARLDSHHSLVKNGVEHIVREERSVGGALGKPSGARFRTYQRIKRYAETIRGSLWGASEDAAQPEKAIDEIYRYPLTQAAIDRLNTHLRSDAPDEMLAQLVILLRHEDRLCIKSEEQQAREPKIICSLGLVQSS